MTLCPIAIAAGCKKCPVVSFCPLKTVIGDYRKEQETRDQETWYEKSRLPLGVMVFEVLVRLSAIRETETMFRTKTLLLAALLVLMSAMQAVAQQEGEGRRMLFDFKSADAAKAWRTVNDGVMGGVSEGSVRVTKEKKLEFFGSLSLENNGGFASVRSRPGKLDLSEYDALVFEVRGDGRTYYANVHVPTRRIAFSYRAELNTQRDKWQEIRIPFKDFRATSFGRRVLDAAPLDAGNIESLGFLLADKKAGPFKLEVAWIKGILKQDR
jgi:NADH dehydrogenase [ubiquinone] 1 alpha subcomplex assembly factor 1